MYLRSAGLLAAALAGMALIRLSPQPATAALPECEQAKTWVDANHESLPSSLDDLRSYSRTYQRVIYWALPRASRVALWREHIAEASGRDDFTVEQIALLREFSSNLDHLMASDLADPVVSAWQSRLLEASPDDLTLFTGFGSDVEDVSAVGCNCNDGIWSCNDITGTNRRCNLDAECNDSDRGCGFMFLGPCDGMCAVVE